MTVFDRNPVPGGMLTLGIPNFRLEKDVLNAEIDILREMGVEFRCGVEVGKDITIEQLRAQGEYLTQYADRLMDDFLMEGRDSYLNLGKRSSSQNIVFTIAAALGSVLFAAAMLLISSITGPFRYSASLLKCPSE